MGELACDGVGLLSAAGEDAVALLVDTTRSMLQLP